MQLHPSIPLWPPVFRTVLLVIGTVFFAVGPAHARQGAPPLSWSRAKALSPLTADQTIEVPFVDAAKAKARDARAEEPGPLRFAEAYEVNCTPQTDGTWDVLPDGSRLWRCQVSCPGATDINFGFTDFHLPAGATLHIFSEQYKYHQGPYTAQDEKTHGELWTPVVPGDLAVIELYLPPKVATEPGLRLTRINRGYRDAFKLGAIAKQLSCENDVICPEGDPWRDEIRSVARYSISGTFLCSGTLIMDAPNSFRNFFITANHCGISTLNDETIVTYWNYESPVCGQHGGGSLSQNQQGSTFRAAAANVDMCLIELDDDPAPAFNVFFAGWDRSGAVPTGSVGIHHPGGDEKSITFNTNALATGDSCIGAGTSTHWVDIVYSDGITEGGSSGSGLWDPTTHLLVGFLSGGDAGTCAGSCCNDCYGKFSVAWDGASSASRLRDWLDPGHTGATSVPGSDPSVALQKTVYEGHDGGASCPGDESVVGSNGTAITYCFTVNNKSGSALTNVYVTDTMLGYSNNVGNLAVGESTTQIVETTLTASLVNTGWVFAMTPLSQVITNHDTAAVSEQLVKPLLIFPDGGQSFVTGGITAITWSPGSQPPGAMAVIEYTDHCSGETTVFSDDMESGINGWTTNRDAGSDDWFQVTPNAHSPVVSWFAADVPSVSDQFLISPAIILPAQGDLQLTFWQDVLLEDTYDGGVIEISTSGAGGPWTDLEPYIVENPYNSVIDNGFGSPIGGQPAYTGDNGGFTYTRVDLSSYAGQTIHLRFRLATDSSLADTGWWIDDVVVSLEQSWSSIATAAPEATSYPWTLPTTPGTDICVRIKMTLPGFADSDWCVGGAFVIGEADTDGDGMPNDWEIDHGLDPFDDGSIDPNNGAMGDPDGDTVSNIEEYLADTHPTNGLLFLKVEDINMNSPVSIKWLTSTGRQYNVEFNNDPANGTNWADLLTGISGSGETNTLPVPSDEPFRAYRIEAEVP